MANRNRTVIRDSTGCSSIGTAINAVFATSNADRRGCINAGNGNRCGYNSALTRYIGLISKTKGIRGNIRIAIAGGNITANKVLTNTGVISIRGDGIANTFYG